MTTGYELELCVKVRGPALSQATGVPQFGIDCSQARVRDKFVLPGTHVKGHLRHVFEQARAAGVPNIDGEWIARWLGAPSGRADESDANAFAFQRKDGLLSVGDLSTNVSNGGTVTRIAIDKERGSVRQGMMQIVEAPWSCGETAVFAGRIRLRGSTTAGERADLRQSLIWALQLIPAVGAFKSAGFGRVEEATLGETWRELRASTGTVDTDAIASAGGADVWLEPAEPFLVWSYSYSGNFFAGDTTIPGQVLKGVAARWLADRGLLKGNEDTFARLIFRHAYPVPAAAPDSPRPIAMPLSIYRVDDGGDPVVVDALESPDEFYGYAGQGTVSFAPDWKSIPNEFAKDQPRAQPDRDSRTRTAVKDGVAEDEKLFTHAAVDPAGCVWRGQILIPQDVENDSADEKAMARLVAALAGTSLGLGKTKVAMDWRREPLAKRPIAERHASGWRVGLQSPACLHGPYGTRSSRIIPDPMAALRADYEAYWKHALGGAGRLVDFMARQRLAGGYLARRYPVTADGYEPYLLTEPGSIFLVEAVGDSRVGDLEHQLTRLAVGGLPLGSGWPQGRHDWRCHPFLPEAGWGEVRIADEPAVPGARS